MTRRGFRFLPTLFPLLLVVDVAQADPIAITGGSVTISDAGAVWRVRGNGFSFESSSDSSIGELTCGPAPCVTGESVFPAPRGNVAASISPIPVTFGDRVVLVDLFLNSLVGTPVRLPAADAIFTTGTTFSAGGFALIRELAGGEPERVGVRGGGNATISFAPDPAVRDGFRLLRLDLEFTDTAPIPEPGTMLLIGAGTIVATLRRRKSGAEIDGLPHP